MTPLMAFPDNTEIGNIIFWERYILLYFETYYKFLVFYIEIVV